MKCARIFIIILMIGFISFLQGQNVVSSEFDANYSRDFPVLFWTDIVTERPESYVEDADGNVHLYSSEALAWLVSVTNGINGQEADNFDGKVVTLEDNVNMAAALWVPISGKTGVSPFKGRFDGVSHVIDSLIMLHHSGFKSGFFGTLAYAQVSNLVFRNGYYDAGSGGFFAYEIKEGCNINHCFLDCEMRVGAIPVAPLTTDCLNSTINNCMVRCPLIYSYGGSNILSGSFVAVSSSSISNCAAIIERLHWTEQCGIVGYSNWGRIKNCYVYLGELIDFGGYGGGLGPRSGVTGVNESSGEIYNCYYNLLKYPDNLPNPSYEIDDQPVIDNYGLIQDAIPFDNDNSDRWKLVRKVSFMLENGFVSTDDLIEALNTKIEELNDETLLTWCDTGMDFDNQLLPVFCGFNTTQINEYNSAEDNVLLYPNPATSQVNITGKNLIEIELVNLLGQRVLNALGENNKIHIDISNLPIGIYFVNITLEGGQKCVKKVMKN